MTKLLSILLCLSLLSCQPEAHTVVVISKEVEMLAGLLTVHKGKPQHVIYVKAVYRPANYGKPYTRIERRKVSHDQWMRYRVGQVLK